MAETAPSSADGNKVSFAELFFDLVFVFSVTQVAAILHHDLSWRGVGEAALVFWLVWWAWSQFTWALNAADGSRTRVQSGVLLATAVAFFMAIAVPRAFHGGALGFAVPYTVVRLLGLGFNLRATSHDEGHWRGVRAFAALSLGGLCAVLFGAIAGGSAIYWAWSIAIVLDVVAAQVAGRQKGWKLDGQHFTERHGLFVIIALGEGVIVAAGGIGPNAEWTTELLAVATLSVTTTCALWWSYFHRAKQMLEHALSLRTGADQAALARDVFTIAHFPMLCGIIAFAISVESAVSRSGQPLSVTHVWLLASGIVLFVGTMGVALWAATKESQAPRLLVSLATAGAIVASSGMPAALTLAIAFAGTVVVAVIEL